MATYPSSAYAPILGCVTEAKSMSDDVYVCLSCGALHHHKGKCDMCDYQLKASSEMTEQEWEDLYLISKTEGWNR